MKGLNKQLLNQLYRYAISLTNDEDHAYDLLQSCIEKYLKRDVDDIEIPVAYIKRMISNEFIDQTRRSYLFQEVDAKEIDNLNQTKALEELSFEDVLVRQNEVESLLLTMAADERELLYLWSVEEYTITEIAKMKQVPRGTLLSRLHRLKKRIQSQHEHDKVVTLRVSS